MLVTPSSSLGGGRGKVPVGHSLLLGGGGGEVHVGHSFLLLPDSKKPGSPERGDVGWFTWNETTLSAIHPTGHSQQETPPGVREGRGMPGERGVGHVEGRRGEAC